jgi:hypothetical protein
VIRQQASLTSSERVGFSRWLLALVLISFISSAAVHAAIESYEKDKCKTTIGRLAVRLKLDSVYSGCRCMKPMLDFSDSCNLALAVGL